MAQNGLMHQPGVAVQPDPRVTPAPHRAMFASPSEKRRGAARPSALPRRRLAATALSRWGGRAPGAGRAEPSCRAGLGPVVVAAAASGPHRALGAAPAHRHARLASAGGSRSVGSAPGERRGPEPPPRPYQRPPRRPLPAGAASREPRAGGAAAASPGRLRAAPRGPWPSAAGTAPPKATCLQRFLCPAPRVRRSVPPTHTCCAHGALKRLFLCVASPALLLGTHGDFKAQRRDARSRSWPTEFDFPALYCVLDF